MNERGPETGAASVEQAGLAALIALLLLVAISAIAAAGELGGGREVGRMIGSRITCGPHLPDACSHHPLVPAYGWPVARVVRALAPDPVAVTGPSGLPLVAVDFRRCRSESCAVPRPGAEGRHLTQSGRRTTAFTVVTPAADGVDITYWLYRLTLGWSQVRRHAGSATIAAAAGTPVRVSDDPALVPLETLPGRNHYSWTAGEEPPWRWSVVPSYPGWSA